MFGIISSEILSQSARVNSTELWVIEVIRRTSIEDDLHSLGAFHKFMITSYARWIKNCYFVSWGFEVRHVSLQKVSRGLVGLVSEKSKSDRPVQAF